MIDLRIQTNSGVPPYLQIVHQLKHALRLGALQPGDRIPTVREAVAALAINPNTVMKAYRELESEGLIGGRPGLGTFVLRSLPGPSPADIAELRSSLIDWLDRARELGLDEASVEALVTTTLRRDSLEEVTR